MLPVPACVDSSIAIAAFGSWHAQHDRVRPALRERPSLVAHAALEAYSVLTRLPDPSEPTLRSSLTAQGAGALLLSIDARAARTYGRLDVAYRLLA